MYHFYKGLKTRIKLIFSLHLLHVYEKIRFSILFQKTHIYVWLKMYKRTHHHRHHHRMFIYIKMYTSPNLLHCIWIYFPLLFFNFYSNQSVCTTIFNVKKNAKLLLLLLLSMMCLFGNFLFCKYFHTFNFRFFQIKLLTNNWGGGREGCRPKQRRAMAWVLISIFTFRLKLRREREREKKKKQFSHFYLFIFNLFQV